MIKLVGTYIGTDSEDVAPSNGGDPFTRHTIKVRNGEGRTYFAQAARDFPRNQLPAVGESVELAVWPRPYVQKAQDKLGCGWTTYDVVTPVLSHV